jgi:4-amino-4-deoxy-L-arabinose transferase-like glycosyltransferase
MTGSTATPSAARQLRSGLLSGQWPVLLVCLLAAALILPGLGKASLKDWDEAIYSQISKEIVQSGDWLTLHWGHQLWFEKPPLLMWGTAAFYRVFGINEFCSRIVSALAGIALAGLTCVIGRRLYGTTVGILSGVILITGSEFLFRARFGTTDVLLTLFTFLAIYAYLRLEDGNDHWWYLVWSAAALAVMTKGAAAAIVPAVIGLSVLLDRTLWRVLRSRKFGGGFALALLIVAPWHIAMHLKYGSTFWGNYLGIHVLSRAVAPLSTYYTGGRPFYLSVLQSEFFPWFFLVPFALAIALRALLRKEIPQSRILILEVLVVFGLYTMVRTKFPWYITPLYPALAILTACMVDQAYRNLRDIAFTGLIIACCFAALFASPWLVLAFGGLAFLCAVWAYRSIDSDRPLRATATVLSLFLLASAVELLRSNYRDGMAPVATLGRIAAASPENHEPLLVLARPYGGTPGPTLMYYSDRPVEWAQTYGDLPQFFKNGNSKSAIIGRNALDSVSKDYRVEVLAESGPLLYVRMTPPVPPRLLAAP